jgi:hypothetical protein
MSEIFVYDKAKWHFQEDYPEDLDDSQAYVHTGLFVGWVIDAGLYSEEFAELFARPIRHFKARKKTGPDVYAYGDGVLDETMLNAEGNAFALDYFEFNTGKYLEDYERLLGRKLPSLYHVPNTWKNYDTLKAQIDKRFAAWRKKTAKKATTKRKTKKKTTKTKRRSKRASPR